MLCRNGDKKREPVEKAGKREFEGEDVLRASGRQSIPCWQGPRHRREEWVLVPTDEKEAGMVQLVGLVHVEPWLAAAVAAHFSDLLAFLIVLVCYLLPSPIHRAAAADIGIGGGLLLVSPH